MMQQDQQTILLSSNTPSIVEYVLVVGPTT